jgi:predicted dithiol-disulfide oxidoreductase (DUF899 family)
MGLHFPNESAAYRAARNQLLAKEIELRRAMEAVAATRRELPPGGLVPQDYVFDGLGSDGGPVKIKLSQLFESDKDSLAVYNFMFPRFSRDTRPGPRSGATARLELEEGPCPSCTAFLDQLDGNAEHLTQIINLAVIAKAPLSRLATFARERGWRHLRLLSSGGNTYKRDYHAEAPDGNTLPIWNVFHRDRDGIRHFWSSEMFYEPPDPDQQPRHAGTIEGLWNIFDWTREGRPSDWQEQLDYAAAAKERRRA